MRHEGEKNHIQVTLDYESHFFLGNVFYKIKEQEQTIHPERQVLIIIIIESRKTG